jgi:hypothetical protein
VDRSVRQGARFRPAFVDSLRDPIRSRVGAAYRRWRYRQYRHATLLELIANVRSAGLLARK